MRRLVVFGIAAGSGILYALAFPPFGFHLLAWVAFVPLLVTIPFLGLGASCGAGFCFGLVHAAISLHWLPNLFGPLAFALWLVFAGFYAVQFALARAFIERWGHGALLWAVPAMWVAVEWFRSEVWPLKFAWFTAGASAHANMPFLQWASFWGVYGMSLIVVLGNGALAFWMLDRRRWKAVAWVTAGVAGLHVFGVGMWIVPPSEPPRLAVAAIEGEGLSPQRFEERIDEAVRLQPETKLVVMPELAFPKFSDDSPAMSRMREVARRHGIVLAFGAFAKDKGERNTVIVLGPDGEVLHRQVKSVPVHFMRDGLPAEDRAPAATPLGKIGFAICYDMDFPFVTRELVAEGAELLVYPTMDAESWGLAMKEQHASLAAIRAVEHRRWVIRCASSGISLIADPDGNVTTGKGEFCSMVESRGGVTLYAKFGYYLPHFCAGFTLALLVLALRRRNPQAPAVLPSP